MSIDNKNTARHYLPECLLNRRLNCSLKLPDNSALMFPVQILILKECEISARGKARFRSRKSLLDKENEKKRIMETKTGSKSENWRHWVFAISP